MPPSSRRVKHARGPIRRPRFPNNLRFYGTLGGNPPPACRMPPRPSEPSGDSVANQNRTGVDHGDRRGQRAPSRRARGSDTCRSRSARSERDLRLDRRRSLCVGRRDRCAHLGRQCRRGAGGRRRGADRQRRPLRAAGRSARTDGRAFDAVMQSGMKDDGAGVPYQVQYALKPTPDPRRCTGSRTPAAGSPAPTARRRAPTASCA